MAAFGSLLALLESFQPCCLSNIKQGQMILASAKPNRMLL